MQFLLLHILYSHRKIKDLTFTLRIFSVVLLAILTAGVFSPFVGSIELLQHQSKMHTTHSETSKTFILSKEAYQQQHHTTKDELLIDGKYFDIHSIVFLNDSVIITGVFDHKESLLREKSNKHLTHHSTRNVQIIFISFFFSENKFELKPLNEIEITLTHSSTYLCPSSIAYISLDEHPPCA